MSWIWMNRVVGCLVASMVWIGLAACTPLEPGTDPGAAAQVRPGYVTDMETFRAFIATGPTPEAFRRTYPDVMLVMPGDITTQEYRTDNSRFFAEPDEAGRIRGGAFR
jgi:hypothetical protein